MKLSIITINYNNKDGLQKTIDSINSQTWREFEWIIIDGGSTDGSRDLIEKTAANPSSNVKYWCSEPDKGVYNAQNKGVSHAHGQYLNFLNSGDTYFSDDTLLRVFSNDFSEDIIYGKWNHLYPRNPMIQSAPDRMSMVYLLTDNICHQAMFVKNEVLQRKGFDENMKIFADWKRWQEAFVEGCTFKSLSCIICNYEAGGLSDTPSEINSRERQMLYDALPEWLKSSYIEHKKIKEKLWRYETNPFMSQTYSFVFERPLYCHFVKLNLVFLRCLKSIVDFFYI